MAVGDITLRTSSGVVAQVWRRGVQAGTVTVSRLRPAHDRLVAVTAASRHRDPQGADRSGVPQLGSLDAIHLASAEPFRTELTEFVTYDQELTKAAADLGFPVVAPS